MITLETERLVLRFYREADLHAYHAMMSNEKNMYYLQDIVTRTVEESRQSLQNAIAVNTAEEARRFAITLKSSDAIIGGVGYEIAARTPGGKIADPMGWFINPEHHNKGYITEAVKRVLAFAFREDDCETVYTGCFAENIPTQRVMAKAGFANEEESEPLWHDGQLKKRLKLSINRNEYDIIAAKT
jgi:ribosomal-protein-alanine N-acetyltransferase